MTTQQIEFHHGRNPNDSSKPRIKFASLLKPTAVEVKGMVDYFSQVPEWPMYGNDKCGDCTCAGAGHMIEQWTEYGDKRFDKPVEDAILKVYETLSGYDPQTGANDTGLVMQDVLDYWRKEGIAGHKIIAFAQVDHKNLDEARQAIEYFGNVYVGINFPKSAMEQFNAGQPWDVVAGAQIEGGHAINVGKYDVQTGTFSCITWAQVQEMTQAFWDQYVEEAWVVFTQDWFDQNGNDPESISISALASEFKAMTGQDVPIPTPTPQPTPQPTPTPTPEPTPTPTPNPEPSPERLLQEIRHILGHAIRRIDLLFGEPAQEQ